MYSNYCLRIVLYILCYTFLYIKISILHDKVHLLFILEIIKNWAQKFKYLFDRLPLLCVDFVDILLTVGRYILELTNLLKVKYQWVRRIVVANLNKDLFLYWPALGIRVIINDVIILIWRRLEKCKINVRLLSWL